MVVDNGIWGYIAGILDGEGSIIISKLNRPENRAGCRFVPFISITNTHKGMLEFIINTTGYGRLHLKNEAGYSKYKDIKATKDCYVWQIKHSQVGELLTKLLPYMVIKKAQAENVLEFLKLFENGVNYKHLDINKQFEFYIKSKQLNGTKITEEEIEALRPIVREPIQIKKKCIIEDCDKDHYGKGLCKVHWKRQYYRDKLAA